MRQGMEFSHMKENDRLHSEKIPKLLISLAAPAICAQIVTLLYNLVDRIYIGQMQNGTLAMAAVGICAPVVTVITAFTGLFGRGGSPLAAIRIGEGNHQAAERYLGNSFAMLIVSTVAIMALTLLLRRPLLLLFGASESTLPYASDYMTTYILGTVFVQMTVGMNYYITTQGFARTAMVTTMLGGVLNIILDPLFIFELGMGVRGGSTGNGAQSVCFFYLGTCVPFWQTYEVEDSAEKPETIFPRAERYYGPWLCSIFYEPFRRCSAYLF